MHPGADLLEIRLDERCDPTDNDGGDSLHTGLEDVDKEMPRPSSDEGVMASLVPMPL